MAAENPDSTWGIYRCEETKSGSGVGLILIIARSGLLQKTPLTEKQFLVVKTGLEPEAAAREYQVEGDNAKRIRILFGDVDDDTLRQY